MAKRRSATEKKVKQQATQPAQVDSISDFPLGTETAGQQVTERKEVSRPKPPMSEVEFNARVARKAYELFERRGGDTGHDVEDWLEAERMVREEIHRESQS